MFSHDDIWIAIDRLAESAGYSTSGLARKAGLDPTAFNRSKRLSPEGKPRWPSTESISKILAVTGLTMTEFTTLVNQGGNGSIIVATQSRGMPMITLSVAKRQKIFDDKGSPRGKDWNQFPLSERIAQFDQGSFAIEISNSDFYPIYRKGDVLIVSPRAAIKSDNRIVIKTTDNKLVACRFLEKSRSELICETLTDKADMITIPTNHIEWVARIT